MFNAQAIGPIQGKVWGTTQVLFAHNSVECHKIEFKSGGFCSKHLHLQKSNRFVVLSGELIVEVFQDDGTVDVTRLMPGQATDVPPGVLHKFTCPTDGVALEMYWCELDPQDIVREDTGGMTNAD